MKNILVIGGGKIGSVVADLLVQTPEATGYRVTVADRSAELVLTDHRSLGPKSLVIIPSLSGTTKESIAALEFCRARGARVITLIGHADTPLGKQADRAFVNFAEDDTSSESFW